MRIILSFIFCFQNIDAGFRDALGRHAVSALSDYAQHRVSTVLLKKSFDLGESFWSEPPALPSLSISHAA